MIVVVATHNRGKAAEFADMLGGTGDTSIDIVWHDLSAYPNAGEVEETGDTFRDNAGLKAAGYATRLGRWALADDSGLEVDALGGRPGVVSARWARVHGIQPDGTGVDLANSNLLLSQLAGVADDRRGARFVCVLALADPRGRVVLTARGTVEGRIVREPRGANGFGYDPLFEVAGTGRTAAELTAAQKQAVGHRGQALRRLRPLMAAYISSRTEVES